MKKLSKEAESKILTALETVADQVNEGTEPTDAIVKAASDHDIPAGHIRLMVSAYNTGRTGKQRMASDNPFDKAANFALADHADVMSKLYPTNVKSAAQRYNETVIDNEYSSTPTFARRKAQEKIASRKIDWKMVDKPAEYPREEAVQVKRAIDSTLFNERRYEECRREVSAVKDKLSTELTKLSGYFRVPGGVSYEDACDIVEIRHGGLGRAVMGQVARTTPQFGKEAGSSRRKVGATTPIDPTQAPWTIIADCVKLASAVHEGAQQLNALRSHVTTASRSALRPFTEKQSNSVLGLAAPIVGESEKQSSSLFLLSNMSENIRKQRKQEEEDVIEDFVEELDDPLHHEDIKRIQVRAQIENMLSNDDLLSQRDPLEVYEAYNEIVQLAPHAATSPLLMRNLLRSHLSGVAGEMDPRDIQTNILSSEKDLATNTRGEYKGFNPSRAQGAGYKTDPGAHRRDAAKSHLKGFREELDKKMAKDKDDAPVEEEAVAEEVRGGNPNPNPRP